MSTLHLPRSLFLGLVLFGLVGAPETSMALATGSIKGHVTIKRGRRIKKDLSNVVIMLKGVPESEPEPLEDPAVIDQTDKSFRPPLTVVPVGSKVDFPNNDRVFHNVFSVSRPAKFDLGLYKSGTSKSVTFDQPGVVDVYCNIHPEMAAKVLVVDTVHHFVTGSDGWFLLENIPPGTYPIIAWQANGEPYEGAVQVHPGSTTTLDIELHEKRWSHPRHTRKDGTPYGRYK